MNRNTEAHFSQVPYIDKPRSIFDLSHGVKTSGNVGDLIPIDWQNIMPGDTWRQTSSKVIRLQTLVSPIMDNMYVDFYTFFCPLRLVFNKTREFFGENTSSAWVQQTSYRFPAISAPEGGFDTGTIADYLGLPVGVDWSNQDRNAPSALPMRVYAMIADQYFRDENITDPLNIPISDADQTGTNGTSYINDVANGGAPFKVAKYHDRFTSCLPSPQKASGPVNINIGIPGGELGPVNAYTLTHGGIAAGSSDASSKFFPVVYTLNDVYAYAPITEHNYPIGSKNVLAEQNGQYFHSKQSNSTTSLLTTTELETPNYASPINLWSETPNLVGNVTVNELRLAFQMQRYYEQLARGGSRYIEYMRNFYGVTSPDARLQRVEYLGGNRIPLNIDQVTNTAQSQQDFLGDLGANSNTSDIHEDFEKSFTEFGILMTVACVRYDHSYSQGIQRKWTRRDLFDQYVPTFAHIGEQPVYKYELYADGNMDNTDVFGYNEAWSDYRYSESIVTGEMRPGITNTLASWHLGDYYAAAPTLSDSWLREDKSMVDRVLAVGSATSNQFFADIWFDQKVTRVMPAFSVPGLIDHF